VYLVFGSSHMGARGSDYRHLGVWFVKSRLDNLTCSVDVIV
nr:hypothetical protein [Tanacetum cinerariifolium]